MNTRLKNTLNYILTRLGEASTWQGLGFFVALLGAKSFGNLDWGAAAAFGGGVSGLIKVLFADSLK